MVFRHSWVRLIRSATLGLVLPLIAAVGLSAQTAEPAPAGESPTPAASASPSPAVPTAPPRQDATIYDAFAPSRLRGSADISVLQSSDIRAIPARNAAELLELVAGVSVRPTMRPSAFFFANSQTISIHGSDAGQVLILVDGRRLNDPIYGAYDLSLLGIDQIERIEIMRSGAAAIYGNSADGGVIYISTHTVKDGFRLHMENQSYLPVWTGFDIANFLLGGGIDLTSFVSGQSGGVNGSFALGKSRLSVNGNLFRDAGLFSFIDNGGANQVNRQIQSYGGNAGIGFDTPLGDDGAFWVKVDGIARRQANPGQISYMTPTAYSDDSALSGNLGWSTKRFISPDLSFQGQIGGGYNHTGLSDGSQANYGNYSIDMRQNARLSEMYSLGYGVSFNHELVSSDSINTSLPLVMRETTGIFVKPSLQTGALRMAPTILVDFFDSFTPMLSVSLDTSISIAPEVGLWLNLGRSYRQPSIIDIYNPVILNSSLQPETVYSGDLGLAIQLPGFTSRSSVFLKYVQNRIVRVMFSPPKSIWTYPANFLDAIYPGFDQDLSLNLGWINAGINYEFQHSYILGGGLTTQNDVRTAMTPDHRLKARLGFKLGGIELGVDGVLVSQGFWDEANTQIMPAYFVMNGHVTFWVSDISNFYVAVDNILNASYRLAQDYPMPGLTIRIGLTLGL